MDHYQQWLDMPLPSLGRRSPREACRTPEGRQRVAILVRTMRDSAIPGGFVPAPRDWLLRELGIAGPERADSTPEA
ncbi:MAG TPA: antitoxin Xre/MbcA/ParS toxin-binding domain-containing protein [Planctomycetota bacterium]|nr:antitoxin Xre/MbcA/ParS toxin-binding domain-containing protein [Planctomycetota bacterium]